MAARGVHPRPRFGVAATAAVLFAGCSILGGVRTFAVGFPDAAGVNGPTVLLTDYTGSVTDLKLGDVAAAPAVDEAHPVPGMPNSIALRWTGGACDEHVDLTTRKAGPLTLKPINLTVTTRTLPGACDAIGIPRVLIISFNQAIDPEFDILLRAP